ncbi:ABC transporter family substrate-binding protein [Pseudonocardia nematodicida]|uniref:ABC transporter family substrate-binding protein n=1 Tax=Pseudonocardia nematodicida TaxID=1206997 RepID=A0ABV1KMR3_9PSEU
MRRPIRRGALTATVAVLALGLAACGGGGGTTGEQQTGEGLSTAPAYNQTAYEDVAEGGTLTTPFRSDLNPQFNIFQGDMTTDTRLAWMWYNPILINYSPTGETQLNPDYIVDAGTEEVDGNTVVTYTLNPEAVFNDGTPIDWRAFEATWQANNGTNEEFINNSTEYYDRITSVEAGADDKEVVVTYDGVFVWWDAPFKEILHPAAANPETFNQGYLNTPNEQWGAGPYTVANFDQNNRTITFERNPNWWGKPGKLDSRTLVQIEPTAAVNAFRNGQIDAAEVRNAEDMAQARDTPDADIRTSAVPATYMFMLNAEAPNLGDIAVRKAIMMAVDRPQMLEIEFQGLDYSEEPAGSMTLETYQEGYEDNFGQVVQYDPEAAGQELEAAGWVAGEDGIRAKDGETLSVGYTQTGDSPTQRARAGAMVAMLREVGIDLQVTQVPASEFSSVMAERNFDIVPLGFRSSNPFGVSNMCQLFCSDSNLNLSGTGTPELDEQMRAVNTLPTAEEQITAANEAERAAFETYGLLPTYGGPEIWVTQPNVANFGSAIFEFPLPETVGFVEEGA